MYLSTGFLMKNWQIKAGTIPNKRTIMIWPTEFFIFAIRTLINEFQKLILHKKMNLFLQGSFFSPKT